MSEEGSQEGEQEVISVGAIPDDQEPTPCNYLDEEMVAEGLTEVTRTPGKQHFEN